MSIGERSVIEYSVLKPSSGLRIGKNTIISQVHLPETISFIPDNVFLHTMVIQSPAEDQNKVKFFYFPIFFPPKKYLTMKFLQTLFTSYRKYSAQKLLPYLIYYYPNLIYYYPTFSIITLPFLLLPYLIYSTKKISPSTFPFH